jgi:hypothetical protein
MKINSASGWFHDSFHPFYRPRSVLGRVEYSATLFLGLGTRRGEGSALRPGRFLPTGKTRYLFYRRLGGFQGRSGQVWKISPPPGFDPRTVQPVASRYADWATELSGPRLVPLHAYFEMRRRQSIQFNNCVTVLSALNVKTSGHFTQLLTMCTTLKNCLTALLAFSTYLGRI